MGRELRRVSLDFDWPLNKVWEGFINPHYNKILKCPHCDNGYTKDGKYLRDLWYGHEPFKPEDNGSVPFTKDEPYILALAKRNVKYEESIAQHADDFFRTLLRVYEAMTLGGWDGSEQIHPESPRMEECVRFFRSYYFPGFQAKFMVKAICDILNGEKPESAEDPRIVGFATELVTGMLGDSLDLELDRLLKIFNSRWCHHLNQEEVDYLVEHDDLWDFTRTWSKETRWVPKDPPYHPTAKEVNQWGLGALNLNSIHQWRLMNRRAALEGLTISCPHCGGEGSAWPDEESKKAYDEWEETPPPEGPGYQVWETVSEGSPITPVFETPESLAKYLADNGQCLMGGNTNYAGWLKWIKGPGWAPSLAMVGGKFVESLGD